MKNELQDPLKKMTIGDQKNNGISQASLSLSSFSGSQSVFTFPDSSPSIKIYKESDYTRIPWKNGLGETVELAIRPAGRSFQTEPFIWRLSSLEIRDSCIHSVMPGYDITVILMPDAHNDPNHSMDLYHNDSADCNTITPLDPYTYSGDWSTVCKLTRPDIVNHLSFMCNRKLAQFSMKIENIVAIGEGAEAGEGVIDHESISCPIEDDKEPLSPTTKFMLGRFTILFVISGSIKVIIEGSQTPFTLEQGQTLVCERDDNIAPTDLSITPISLFPDDVSKQNSPKAIVLTIQLQVFKSERSESVSASPKIYAQSSGPTRQSTRGRTISLINLQGDDQGIVNMDPEYGMSSNHGASAQRYKPPVFAARHKNESEVPPPIIRDDLNIDDYPLGTISTAWINMMKQGLSDWIRVPVIIARGSTPGPVVGITAVVHGNELNGVPCIHRVITDINVHYLKGTVVAVPCVNVPGYLRYSREFSDGKDLNRGFPGMLHGTSSQVYNYNFFEKIITKLNFLIDLHTASFGRVNSYYVRSDMNDLVASVMAKLQQPQVILHNSGQDGTLRSAAANIGIKAITVEIGNPQLLQNHYVQWSYLGVMRILAYLNMFEATDISPVGPNTLLCSKGFWIYTETGGVLEVYPQVNTIIRKGDLIARIKNIFGNIVAEMFAPKSGVVIGRSSNPVAMAGDRVIHMGILKKENEVLPKEAKENY